MWAAMLAVAMVVSKVDKKAAPKAELLVVLSAA